MDRRIGAIVLGVGFAIWGLIAAGNIESDWEDDESRTSGAPQQQVVASWAVKDAAIVGVRMLGVLGGLIVVASVLIAGRDLEDDEDAKLETGLWQRCPACFDIVRAGAVVCRSCRSDLPPPVEKPTEPAPVGPSDDVS